MTANLDPDFPPIAQRIGNSVDEQKAPAKISSPA
jgi:hypothetical protein